MTELNSDERLDLMPSRVLLPEEFRHTVFESSKDYYEQCLKSISYYAEQNDINTKVMSIDDMVNIISTFVDIIAEPLEINGTIEYRLYIRHYDESAYYLLTTEAIQSRLIDLKIVFGTKGFVLWQRATSVTRRLIALANLHVFPEYKPAPSYYVLTFNGIFNRKTKEFYPEKSDKYTELTKKYHFIDNASFNYLTESKHPEIVELYEEFIEYVSEDDTESRDKVEQLLCSVLEGYNHDGLVFITSWSRLSLDLFSRLMQTLASEYMHEHGIFYRGKYNNEFSHIKYNTKLMIGSIYKQPDKLSPAAIEKCRQVIDGNSFITARPKGYKEYFKLRIPWVQVVYNPLNMKVFEQATEGIKSSTLVLYDFDIDEELEKEFEKKFLDAIETYATPAIHSPVTEFSDEVATYLLNTVDYKGD